MSKVEGTQPICEERMSGMVVISRLEQHCLLFKQYDSIFFIFSALTWCVKLAVSGHEKAQEIGKNGDNNIHIRYFVSSKQSPSAK